MSTKRVLPLLLCAGGLMWCAGRLLGDEVCVVVSAGSSSHADTGSILNVGQTAIGTATDGVITMYAGGIPCFALHLVCLLGDVNGDGLIDGLDVNEYVRVKLTGSGTARELCAANISVADFVTLLLES